MKTCSILISFCIIAITAAKNIETFQQTHAPQDLNTDTLVSQLFEVVKWMIKNGSPDVFPVLDPMNLYNQTFHMSLPNKMFTISANFTNALLKGLGDFEMLQVKFFKSEVALFFSINFPLMTLTAVEYEMEGDIYEAIPLTGYGAFEFQMKNFNFSSKVYIKQSENGESAIIDKFEDTQFSIDKITFPPYQQLQLQIQSTTFAESLTLRLTHTCITKIESYTEFDKNIDDIFSALVGDLLADYLTRFNKYIIKTYTDDTLEILNPFLEEFESWKFIEAILQINIRVLLFLILPTMMGAYRTEGLDTLAELSLKKRNMLVNMLINKLFAYIRHVISHGSPIVGIPVLDPFKMEDFHLIIPTGLINLDLRLTNISVIGFKGFVLHKNILHLSNLTFDMEVSLPRVVIAAETIYVSEIDTGNFISAIPIIANKEKTELKMDNFLLQTTLQLKQSEDEKSILIDKIENVFWVLPSFKLHSEGITDGENFEILPELEDSFVEYAEHCKNTITAIISNAIITFGNPILNRLDSWRYIAILL